MTQPSATHHSWRSPAPWFRIALGMFSVAFGANLFAPLLPVMRDVHSLSQAQVSFLLAVYIIGLVPALLIGGPASDRAGRRAVVRPALIFSAIGTATTLAAHFFTEPISPLILVIGRMLTGIAVGLVLAAGASWLKEVSAATDGPGAAARRATIATSAGFGVGPLITGPVAEWLPGPDTTGLGLHLVMVVAITPLVWTTPTPDRPAPSSPPTTTPTAPTGPTRAPGAADPRGPEKEAEKGARTPRSPLIPPSARTRAFLIGVAIWAPWAFGCATTSFAALTPLISNEVGAPVAYTGLIGGVTMLTGAAVQPRIGRYSDRLHRISPAVLGLLCATIGMLSGALIATFRTTIGSTAGVLLMIPTAMLLGTAYGILMVSGLRVVQRIAPDAELGALTGIFYSLTYLGFFAPFIIALITPVTGNVTVYLLGAFIAVATAVLTGSTASRTSATKLEKHGLST